MPIARAVEKHTGLTAGQYNGHARHGEIVVDLDTNNVYVGLADKSLQLLSSGIGAQGHVASFYDTTTQTNPAANVPMAVKINNTDISSGIRVVNGTKIYTDFAGVYNLEFSLQVEKTDSGDDFLEIWLNKNGSIVPWTNTRFTLEKNDTKLVAAWNLMTQTQAGDYVELMWASADTAMQIVAIPATATRPGVPSAIITVTQV